MFIIVLSFLIFKFKVVRWGSKIKFCLFIGKFGEYKDILNRVNVLV